MVIPHQQSLLLTAMTLQPEPLHEKMVNSVYSISSEIALDDNTLQTRTLHEKMVK